MATTINSTNTTSWRDELRKVAFAEGEGVGASFRGVPFRTTDADTRVGRRNVLHEYPQRDVPFAEDLGRRARQFQVQGYVLGDDYLRQRDALIGALETAGPGELVHPRYGALQVVVLDQVNIRESHGEGGMARFAITFVEAGRNEFPQDATDTAEQVHDAADALEDAAAERFAGLVDVAGVAALAQDLSSQVLGALDSVRNMVSLNGVMTLVGDVVRTISSVADRVSSLIRTPLVLAQELQALYQSVSLAVQRPGAALEDLREQFSSNSSSSGSTSSSASTTTSSSGSTTGGLGTAAQRQINAEATRTYLRATSLSTQSRVLSDAMGGEEIATAQDASAQSEQLLAQIDTELERHDPPAAVATALRTLRAAVVRDVAEQAERGLQRGSYTTQAVLPALLIAQRVYQDASRADELVARNGVRHPLFVPAGALEVLR
jgi:prophage DNA circulation protein